MPATVGDIAFSEGYYATFSHVFASRRVDWNAGAGGVPKDELFIVLARVQTTRNSNITWYVLSIERAAWIVDVNVADEDVSDIRVV